jgi:glycosyltransferase involved in cell wall biosynthesis
MSPRDLTLGFSVRAREIGNIRVPEALGDAELIIVVQGLAPGEQAQLPDALEGRARVVCLNSVGVAKSRNEALRQAGRRFLLFCDDDVVIDPDGVLAAMSQLDSTGAALALGRALDEHGLPRKNYADSVKPLTLFTSAKAATYEMLVNVTAVREAGVAFDEDFGAGAANYLGDEYIFIADLIREGATCLTVPHVYGMHPADSSGSRWNTSADLEARGKAIERAFMSRATVPKALFAAKNRRQLGSWRSVTGFVCSHHLGNQR